MKHVESSSSVESSLSTRSVLKKMVFQKLPQNSQESTCAKASFLTLKKDTPAQVFSCEFYESSKNTFFAEHLRWTASEFISHIDVELRVILKRHI